MMKMNKDKFLKTELGTEMKNCIDCWDLYLNKDFDSAKLCQAQWEVYQMAVLNTTLQEQTNIMV